MGPTDVNSPHHYHKVVDCQYACPAHTNVPEYLRLIAQGEYSESYLLNRQSNVFPGILGRTCDRPCEPACRRGRVDGKPVAICRLKRVAADLRDDITDRLPTAPAEKNGKRIALIGCGPSSLTVANDLLPLGYDVTIYEKHSQAGGLMRFNIPAFRLPAQVLDDETGYIIDMGATVRYDTPVDSLKSLLDEGYDAVYIGSGAPKGKELDIPGRWDGNAKDVIHIGIEWLGSVHFGHIEKIEPRVLIIGVGNTAMDCCRTSKRLGATDVQGATYTPHCAAIQPAKLAVDGLTLEVHAGEVFGFLGPNGAGKTSTMNVLLLHAARRRRTVAAAAVSCGDAPRDAGLRRHRGRVVRGRSGAPATAGRSVSRDERSRSAHARR